MPPSVLPLYRFLSKGTGCSFSEQAGSQMVRLSTPEVDFSVSGLMMLQLPESLPCAEPYAAVYLQDMLPCPSGEEPKSQEEFAPIQLW